MPSSQPAGLGASTRPASKATTRPITRPTTRPTTKPSKEALKAKNKLAKKGIIAEPGVPHIDYAFPPGGRQGATLSVEMHGDELDQVSDIRFSGSGVEGKIAHASEEGVTATIHIAPDASPGPRDMRIIRATGVSNRFRFFVGQIPEVNAVMPRAKGFVQALPALPVTVNGWVMSAQTHAYSFSAKAGQKLVLRVQSQEIIPLMADAVPGWAQMVLTLFDPDGKEMAYLDDAGIHPDPVLIQGIPRDGLYRVEIRDALYRGRENFLYRLSIGELPYLTSIFPLGGAAGQAGRVELFGANLPANSLDLAAPDGTRNLLPIDVKSALTSNWLPYQVERIAGSPVSSAATTQPARVTVPAVLDGRITRAGQEDVFTFHAEAKKELVFEVFARRLDSPLDSVLTVTDAKGGRLGQNDDYVDERFPLVTHQADSRLSVKFAAAGDYLVRLADAQGKFGPDYAYRLVISQPRPDFALMVLPDNPRVAPGDQAVLSVHAIRRDGFDGEIRLSLKDLPPGFTAGGATVGPKEADARFTITAPADAKPGQILRPTLQGRATIDSRDVVHDSLPAEQLMQAFSYIYRIPTEEFLLQVLAPPAFVLSASGPGGALEVPQGGEVKLTVKVSRKVKMSGAIGLTLDQPAPRGLSMRYAPIPPDKDEAQVVLQVSRQAPAGRTLYAIIAGTSRSTGVAVVKYVPAIAIKVTPGATSQPATRPTTRPATLPSSGPATKPSTEPTSRPASSK